MGNSTRYPGDPNGQGSVTRRQFVARAAVWTSGVALLRVIPSALAQTPACAAETLRKIGEIASLNGKLKGVLKIKNFRKALPGLKTGQQQPMMRYFEGYDQQRKTLPVWPPDKSACLPGPTLRVKVGEQVEITFLNQVDVGQFPGGTLDNAETGATTGCDEATNTVNLKDGKPDKDWYPKTRGDSFPNCFHGSSTANLHFHGTHITPDGFGDNVLVQLRPDPKIDENDPGIKKIFDDVFNFCAGHEQPPPWNDLPASFRQWQKDAVKDYDLHAIWKGKRGPKKNSKGEDVPELPHENQLWPPNRDNIDGGFWPQYFVGGFPNCFKITEAPTKENGLRMGQAPGTHWYHSHKHGSTAINLFNGLAGVLIIEGKYDEDLAKIYPNLKTTEKVLIVQVFTDLPDLERPAASRGLKATVTNGTPVVKATKTAPQTAPAIVMRPGEIQLWRIVNAQVRGQLDAQFALPAGDTSGATLPRFRQTAMDGVQLSFYNYDTQLVPRDDYDLAGPPETNVDGTKLSLAPGNRADILVKAPLSLPKGKTSQAYELSGVANLTVCGVPVAPPQEFPVDGNYPKFPGFLRDINRPKKTRNLIFGWEPYRINSGETSAGIVAGSGSVGDPYRTTTHQLPLRDANGNKVTALPFVVSVDDGRGVMKEKEITIEANRAPYFMIDHEQFSEHKFHQTMTLDEDEDWTIYNWTSVPHPFHIHVNPFQVIASTDPNLQRTSDFSNNHDAVWQDVVNIPPAKTYKNLNDPNDPRNGTLIVNEYTGVALTPGSVVIRTRFVDFPGTFVLHCHILAHEDRGMMQLVRVIDGRTSIKHH